MRIQMKNWIRIRNTAEENVVHHLGEDGLVEGTAGRGPRVHGAGREQRTRCRAGIGKKNHGKQYDILK